MKAFTTTKGRTIPPRVVLAVADRLHAGEDSQKVMTEELRDYIPEHEDDLDEANEVINHALEINAERDEVRRNLDEAWAERDGADPERDMELAQQIGEYESEARELGL